MTPRQLSDGRMSFDDHLQQARVELDAELVRHGDQHGVRRLHRRILRQLVGDHVGLADVAPAEAGETAVEVADLVLRSARAARRSSGGSRRR